MDRNFANLIHESFPPWYLWISASQPCHLSEGLGHSLSRIAGTRTQQPVVREEHLSGGGKWGGAKTASKRQWIGTFKRNIIRFVYIYCVHWVLKWFQPIAFFEFVSIADWLRGFLGRWWAKMTVGCELSGLMWRASHFLILLCVLFCSFKNQDIDNIDQYWHQIPHASTFSQIFRRWMKMTR